MGEMIPVQTTISRHLSVLQGYGPDLLQKTQRQIIQLLILILAVSNNLDPQCFLKKLAYSTA